MKLENFINMKRMKYYKFILLGMLIMIFSNCNNQQKNMTDISNLHKIDTVLIKRSVMKHIHRYIANHPETDIYILKSMQWYKDNNIEDNLEGIGVRRVFNEIYEIACANSFSIGHGEFVLSRNYPGQYFEMANKIVFVCSDHDALYNQKLLKKEYFRLVTRDVENSTEYILVYDLEDKAIVLSKDEVYGSEYIKQINHMIKIISNKKYKAPILKHTK